LPFFFNFSQLVKMSHPRRFDEAEHLWHEPFARMQRILGTNEPDTANCLIGWRKSRYPAEAPRCGSAVAGSQPGMRFQTGRGARASPLKGQPDFEKLLAPAKSKQAVNE
jgi:hypothetical protein